MVTWEAGFRARKIDFLSVRDVKQKESLEKDLGDKINIVRYSSPNVWSLMLNMRMPIFQDIRVREAIHRAIDKTRIIDIVYFGDALLSWWIPDGRVQDFPIGYDAVESIVGYDVARSTQLVEALKADGTYGGEDLELMVPAENQDIVDAFRLIAEDLEKVGFNIKVKPEVRNIYVQRAGAKPEDRSKSSDFTMAMTPSSGFNSQKTFSGSFWNNNSLEDDEIDSMILKIEETLDAEERLRLSHEWQLALANKYMSAVPVLSRFNYYGHQAYVKGIDFEENSNGNSGWQTELWLDKA